MTTPKPLTTSAAVARTGAQSISAYGVVELLEAFSVTHMTTRQGVALAAVLTPLIAYLMRMVEGLTGKGLFRTVAKSEP